MPCIPRFCAEKVLTETAQKRLVSLDVFRGMTIAGMILVNNPGDWGAIYSPLQHAPWHGLTPTDLIFPFFLFIVGIAIPIALTRRIDSEKPIYGKIYRRSALIFLIGLFLNAFPLFDFANLRIPGVLQRIAVCYLIASLIFVRFNWREQTFIAVALLVFYWIVMTVVPVPGCEVATVHDKACNLSAYIDRLFLGVNHIWVLGKVYDPEGILSTLPAISTTISGVLTGMWLRSKRQRLEKITGLLVFGLLLIVLGWACSFFMPINKSLWTSSYVVYTSGIALCFLGVLMWIIDMKGYKAWSKPFVVFGMNALALYIGAEMLSRLLSVISFSDGKGGQVSLKTVIFENVFAPIASPLNASLAYAITFILGWLLVLWVLYRKKIFIKV